MIDELFDRNAAWALTKTKTDPGYFRRLAAQQTPRFGARGAKSRCMAGFMA